MLPADHVRRACDGGDLTESLLAIRDVLADRLDGATAKDAAPLARQLGEVLRQLAELTAPEEEDAVDAIVLKLASGGAGPAAPRRT